MAVNCWVGVIRLDYVYKYRMSNYRLSIHSENNHVCCSKCIPKPKHSKNVYHLDIATYFMYTPVPLRDMGGE